MPLHGKIVVIKRSGGDGTEFPLTATCMFGRKPDCDIRIQLPQVSKEHCRIDLNENKEVVLTNLSSVNPTRINGEALQQAERLKHGDVITVIDRSFRFEYPPAPTPKKRSSTGGKSETLKVLQDQQVVDTLTVETGEKKVSEVFTDGANHDNIRRTLDNTVEVESNEDATQLQNKTNSPFNDLYQMIKKSLDVKTPRKSSASLLQTPASKFCTPKPASVRKSEVKPVIFKEDQGTPQIKNGSKVTPEDESCNPETPKSVKKQRKSSPTSSENPGPAAEEVDHVIKSETTSPQRRTRVTPRKFTAAEVMKQACVETPKSPLRRSSRETTPVKPAVTAVEPEPVQRKSPRNSGKAEQVNETTKKRKAGQLAADLPTSQMKRKRVSFGGALSPELFDKRLPPNSPLCKGAFPRRSLCLNKPKESLLRRASTIGLLKPKASSPGKKSPNSKASSPKAASPGKKSPKSATPAKKSPKTPSSSSTPTVQGRFSVSRISTPSPVTEDSDTFTPKIPLKRKSMKGTSRKTPIIAKSAVKGIRRSGISRASMKVQNSWVDIVKFGQPKAQVIAPVIKMAPKKTTKKTVSKPQTPARNIKGHVSTGHADSPATIVVGRAHTQSALHPTGAAPRLVPNIALLKKNMKMDEDLTGIPEMYKTPVNERKKRSAINESVDKTPAGVLGTSVVEPSVLNTPEGPGEMMVSPLNLASAVKESYNSEAVQRLLNEDKDSSFVSVIPALEIPSDESSEQQSTTVKKTPVKTPKPKPEQPECLSGTKRTTRTPKQKPEPVEDLRGKILKTPKQKPEQQECLTGVKRIMKTPKQKIEQQECLTGVKKIFETPQKEALKADDVSLCGVEEPQETPAHVQESEDLSEMADVKTLNAKSSPVLCLEKELDFANKDLQEDKPSHVINVVPQVDTVKEAVSDEVVNDTEEEPSEKESSDVMETISQAAQDESLPEEQPEVNTVKNLSEEQPEVEAVKNLSEEQPEVEAVVEEQPEVDAVVEEQPEVDAVVEEQPEVDAVVEEQPEVDAVVEEQPEVDAVVEEQPEVDAVVEEQPEVDAVVEEQPEVEAVVEEQPEVEAVVEEQPEVEAVVEEQPEVEAVVEEQPEVDAVVEEQPEVDAIVENLSEEQPEVEAVVEEQPEVEAVVEEQPEVEAVVEEQPEVEAVVEEQPEVEAVVEEQPKVDAIVENLSEEQPEVEAVVEEQPEVEAVVKNLSEEQPEVIEIATGQDTEMETAAADPVKEKKAVRGRRAKTVEPEAVEDKQDAAQHTEEPVTPAPVRGRRGKKTETPAPSTVEQKTRKRNAKTTESKDADLTVEESASQPPKIDTKPRRGRNAKKASDDQAEMVATEAENAPEAEGEQIPAVEVDHKADESVAPQEKVAPKLKRARKPKQETEPSHTEQQDVPEEPVVPAPIKGRRGKRTEATAAPAVRQTTRTRNARSQENTSDDKPEAAPETSLEIQPEVPSEAVTEQTAPPAEEAVVKPVRGRKTKPTPVAPPQPEPENADEPQQPIPTAAKTRRGRKIKSDTTEQTGAAEDTLVTVETKQESQPPVRVKRGRNAKQQEEKQENDVETISPETSDVQEPVKKSTRTRKTKEECVKPKEEEIKTDETIVPEEAESVLVAEPLENEQVPITEKKTRRGAQKAKQAAESETPVESTEVEEVPAVKPKRGRRVKEATEVPAEVPEAKSDLKAEEETAEPDAPVVKPTRARGVKTVKNQVSEAIPAKRARRGAAALTEDTESTAMDVPAAEPAKRGKRAAAKLTTDEVTVSSDQVNTSEDSTSAVTEDVKGSKRSVKWKSDPEVLQIPKATPVKAVRGKKSKLVDTESKSTSSDADKTEEKDLSEEVVEAQPVKRARRVTKVTEETVDPKKDAEAETQPKTRKGRSTRK